MRVYKTSLLPIILAVLLSLNIMGCGAGGAGTGVVTGGDNQQQTMLQAENISKSPVDSYKPVISADARGNVYVAWEEGNINTLKKIYLGTSSNTGNAFSVKKDITNHIGYDISSPYVGLKKNGEFAVVWANKADKKDSQTDIFYTYTKDYGETFSPADTPENISKSESDSSEPLIGFEGTLSGTEGSLSIDAVWVEGSKGARNVAFSRAAGIDSNFSTPQMIFSAAIDSDCPVTASSGLGKIYVAYRGDNRIYFARWESRTSSFSDIGYVSPDSVSPSCPEVGVSSTGVIYVVWSDAGRIWVATSADTGYSFPGLPKPISDAAGIASSPKIAIDGNYINLVWVEDETGNGNGDIFFSGSVDNGQSFSSPRNLSNTSDPSQSPVITTDSSKYIYVAWTEGKEGSRDIYFIRDKGARDLVKF
ncbi:MAG: hypothetical protein PH343_06250 [Nitrospira sp.]|nr:hypothetical protein [Nitrospira sp.]